MRKRALLEGYEAGWGALEEKLWFVVDANGLSGLPSDILEAVRVMRAHWEKRAAKPPMYSTAPLFPLLGQKLRWQVVKNNQHAVSTHDTLDEARAEIAHLATDGGKTDV